MDPVEGTQGFDSLPRAQAIGQGDEIQVVSGGIALEDQRTLDAQDFRLSRNG